MEIAKNNINSALFLKYLIEEGKFNPNNYDGILELGQSAPNSLSQFLTDYRQYLLSKKVEYHELDSLGIDGAFGYLDNSNILVPKTLGNDNRFIHYAPKVLGTRHGYNYPSIEEFGAIVCMGMSDDLLETLTLSHDIYFGYCRDSYKQMNIRQFIERIAWDNDYEIKMDIDSSKGKEYCLIKKR